MTTTEPVSQYELERGKPMPSMNHSFVQTKLIGLFFKYSDKYSIFSELSLKLGDFKPTPDISIYNKLTIDWTHDIIKMTEPPLLVIEIMSPYQGTQEAIDKIALYFKNGIKSCWLVHPSIKTITVYTPDMKFKTFTSGIIKDHATDIEVAYEDIFVCKN